MRAAGLNRLATSRRMPKPSHSTRSTAAAARQTHARIFAALADETRLALLGKLGSGPALSITQLASDATITRQAITKHLRQLERVQIVRCRRAGRESVYELDPKPLMELSEYLSLVSHQWDNALARLKAFAETQ